MAIPQQQLLSELQAAAGAKEERKEQAKQKRSVRDDDTSVMHNLGRQGEAKTKANVECYRTILGKGKSLGGHGWKILRAMPISDDKISRRYCPVVHRTMLNQLKSDDRPRMTRKQMMEILDENYRDLQEALKQVRSSSSTGVSVEAQNDLARSSSSSAKLSENDIMPSESRSSHSVSIAAAFPKSASLAASSVCLSQHALPKAAGISLAMPPSKPPAEISSSSSSDLPREPDCSALVSCSSGYLLPVSSKEIECGDDDGLSNLVADGDGDPSVAELTALEGSRPQENLTGDDATAGAVVDGNDSPTTRARETADIIARVEDGRQRRAAELEAAGIVSRPKFQSVVNIETTKRIFEVDELQQMNAVADSIRKTPSNLHVEHAATFLKWEMWSDVGMCILRNMHIRSATDGIFFMQIKPVLVFEQLQSFHWFDHANFTADMTLPPVPPPWVSGRDVLMREKIQLKQSDAAVKGFKTLIAGGQVEDAKTVLSRATIDHRELVPLFLESAASSEFYAEFLDVQLSLTFVLMTFSKHGILLENHDVGPRYLMNDTHLKLVLPPLDVRHEKLSLARAEIANVGTNRMPFEKFKTHIVALLDSALADEDSRIVRLTEGALQVATMEDYKRQLLCSGSEMTDAMVVAVRIFAPTDDRRAKALRVLAYYNSMHALGLGEHPAVMLRHDDPVHDLALAYAVGQANPTEYIRTLLASKEKPMTDHSEDDLQRLIDNADAIRKAAQHYLSQHDYAELAALGAAAQNEILARKTKEKMSKKGKNAAGEAPDVPAATNEELAAFFATDMADGDDDGELLDPDVSTTTKKRGRKMKNKAEGKAPAPRSKKKKIADAAAALAGSSAIGGVGQSASSSTTAALGGADAEPSVATKADAAKNFDIFGDLFAGTAAAE
ncbi:unnamed protein product [Amoebophrya sp. A25]|nr:unnamed protein product [Amoebophrya sp. A25]|eukprot:GSA25T00016389001.1